MFRQWMKVVINMSPAEAIPEECNLYTGNP